MEQSKVMGGAPSLVNPADRAIVDGLVSWDVVADVATSVARIAVEKLARKAADDFYEHLLHSVQDYFCDNIKFNIGSRLDAAERERRAQWDRAEECERRALAAEERARTAEGQVAILIKAMPAVATQPPTGAE
jgi:hypothetical protein